MIPIQYRDSETEEILDCRYEESVPDIGQKVFIEEMGEFQVLYRWRCTPTACMVYVKRAERRMRVAA